MSITMTSRLTTPGLRTKTSPRELKPAQRLLKLIALATLAADSTMRERMGAVGRDFASRRFDWRMMVQRLQNVYEQALK